MSHLTLQSPSTSKAKLISRMAKMGQPMLPMSGSAATAGDSTDSENDVSIAHLFHRE